MMKALNSPVTSWAGKRVWLVGASSGIGAALAQALLKAGAHVAVSARRAEQLVMVADSHANAHVVPLDVTQSDAWPVALTQVLERLGHIDLVVLGAARYDPTHSWQIDLEQVEKSFDVNVVSLYRGLSVVVPYMLERGHGGISMIASISGYTGLPRALIYGATKAALQNLAETLYFELAPKGLSIYLINPGFVQTPMTSDNDFKMPGLMMPEAAAQAIMAGFERGDFEIRFPKTFSFVLRLVSMLPDRVRFALLHKTTGM
jgi:short-subunit dehydrogenase